MGLVFKFPFDLAFDAHGLAPIGPSPDPSLSVLEYIKHTAPQVDSAQCVVALTIEDRRKAHRNRVNEGRSAPSFAPGDLVLLRIQVQSNTDQNRVAKLSYQVHGPYRIVSHSASSYKVAPVHQPGLNPLSSRSPSIACSCWHPPLLSRRQPGPPIPQSRMLRLLPTTNPLKRHLNIEEYNEVWFSDKPPSTCPSYPVKTIQPAVSQDRRLVFLLTCYEIGDQGKL